MKLTILCADDNHFNIEILRISFIKLDLLDYCSFVFDGKEVVNWCKKNAERARNEHEKQIVIVVTDLEMPHKNGLQAVKEVREHYNSALNANESGFALKMPTFVLSSSRINKGFEQTKDFDVDYIINKPPDDKELERIVLTAVRHGKTYYERYVW